MRSLRFTTTVLVLVAALRMTAMGQQNAKSAAGPGELLKLMPKFIQSSEYDTPSEPAAVSACKVESVVNDQNRSIGYILRDGQGKLLRRFVAARGGRSIDTWSYYQDGFEVYREEDLDGDRSLDECRWLNCGGTRIAKIEQGADRRLEADHSRRGVEGAGSGTRQWRPGIARNRDGHAGRLDGRRRPEGGGRQDRRGGLEAREQLVGALQRQARRLDTSRPSGTGSTARFPTSFRPTRPAD